MRPRTRNALLALLGAPLVIGAAWVASHWTALSTFPLMPSAYEAKEYCSCRFVEDRDPVACDRFVYQDIVPTQGRTVDEEARSVTARALWVSTTARWVSDRAGCVLE